MAVINTDTNPVNRDALCVKRKRNIGPNHAANGTIHLPK